MVVALTKAVHIHASVVLVLKEWSAIKVRLKTQLLQISVNHVIFCKCTSARFRAEVHQIISCKMKSAPRGLAEGRDSGANPWGAHRNSCCGLQRECSVVSFPWHTTALQWKRAPTMKEESQSFSAKKKPLPRSLFQHVQTCMPSFVDPLMSHAASFMQRRLRAWVMTLLVWSWNTSGCGRSWSIYRLAPASVRSIAWSHCTVSPLILLGPRQNYETLPVHPDCLISLHCTIEGARTCNNGQWPRLGSRERRL